jgi:hypothetical protein
MKVYVASSWKNQLQEEMCYRLRTEGRHQVYDFKHPNSCPGFHWSSIGPGHESWTAEQLSAGLEAPRARETYHSNFEALSSCDVCVLVLPCGRSSHLEAGYAVGCNRPLYILQLEPQPAELMYRMARKVVSSIEELIELLEELREDRLQPWLIQLPGQDGAMESRVMDEADPVWTSAD